MYKTHAHVAILRNACYIACIATVWEDKMPALKWTKTKCAEAAAQCGTMREFAKKFPGAYDRARDNGWLDEVCPHMKRRGDTKYTFEAVAEEARKYRTRKELKENAPRFYSAAYRKGWLDKVCSHMVRLHNMETQYPIEVGRELAKNCKSRSEFGKRHRAAYAAARRGGWLDEICAHMKPRRKPQNYWTKNRCHSVAKQFNTLSEFQLGAGSAYQIAHRSGWLRDICGHMVSGHGGGFDANSEGCLYYIRVDVDQRTFYKIGITNGDALSRFRREATRPVKITVIKEWFFEDGHKARERETEILREFKDAKYTGEPILLNGNRELFTYDVLQLDSHQTFA